MITGNGEKIIFGEPTDFHCENTMQNFEAIYGKNIENQIRVRVYPKKIDTTIKVLFALDSPIVVPPSSTKTFTGTFKDGNNPINGTGFVDPVANTDYTANTKPDGSGTDVTDSFLVAAVFSSQSVNFAITNNSIYPAHITKLTARGYGITSYNPIDSVVESQDSIERYGYESIDIEQKYQSEITAGYNASKSFLNNSKNPETTLDKIYFLANKSEALMHGYLTLDVGSKIYVTEIKNGIDSHYYIQSVDFDISIGGIIKYSWRVVETRSLERGLFPVEVHFEYGTKQAIDFGVLPQLANLRQRTYSFWLKDDDENRVHLRGGMGVNSDYAGTVFYPASAHNYNCVYVYSRFSNGVGAWGTPSYGPFVNTWYFCAMTMDYTNEDKSVPKIYINGVEEPIITVNSPPLGSTYRDEEGCNFILGNQKTATLDFNSPLAGSMKDVRVYNRVLSSAEIAGLYSGANVTQGLVFHGLCAKNKDKNLYAGKNLTGEQNIIDNIYGFVGTPIDSPLCKEA